MLFSTVYGPELRAIHQFIWTETELHGGVDLERLNTAFIPRTLAGERPSTNHVRDALSFLASCGLVANGQHLTAEALAAPFPLEVLGRMRALQQGETAFSGGHALDSQFMAILDRLFVQRGIHWIADLATEVRHHPELDGQLNDEKVAVWARVMEGALGLGHRSDKSGFYLVLSPDLLRQIVRRWPNKRATLEEFLRDGLGRYLPYQTPDGDLSPVWHAAFQALVDGQVIELRRMVDSPARPYWGANQYRELVIREEYVNA